MLALCFSPCFQFWCLLAITAVAGQQPEAESCQAAAKEAVQEDQVRSLLHVQHTATELTAKGTLNATDVAVEQPLLEKEAPALLDERALLTQRVVSCEEKPGGKSKKCKCKGGGGKKKADKGDDEEYDCDMPFTGGPLGMDRTSMDQDDLPKESRHINGETYSTDWNNEYGQMGKNDGVPLYDNTPAEPPQRPGFQFSRGTCAEDPNNPWCGPYLAFFALLAAAAVLGVLACWPNRSAGF